MSIYASLARFEPGRLQRNGEPDQEPPQQVSSMIKRIKSAIARRRRNAEADKHAHKGSSGGTTSWRATSAQANSDPLGVHNPASPYYAMASTTNDCEPSDTRGASLSDHGSGCYSSGGSDSTYSSPSE